MSPTVCVDLHNQFQITEYCIHLPLTLHNQFQITEYCIHLPLTLVFFYRKVPEILLLLLNVATQQRPNYTYLVLCLWLITALYVCTHARAHTHEKRSKNEIKDSQVCF